MSNTVLLVIHVIVSVILILIILLQIGKGASLSNLFGGGSSDAVFSGAGGDVFMKKLTVGFAIAFVVTSLGLTVLSSRRPAKSVVQDTPSVPPPSATVGSEESVPTAQPPVTGAEDNPAEPLSAD